MLTMADKGGRGVWEMLTMADKGGRGGLDPLIFGHTKVEASTGVTE